MNAVPQQPLRFSKMHGAGNDFVVLDLRNGEPPPTAQLCRVLADRHRGVGCDQIITIESPHSTDALASYRIWNADGSLAQQCGNGARCVAAWLVRAGVATDGETFVLDSPSGMHAVSSLGQGRFRIAMGIPQFAPERIPLIGFRDARDEYALTVEAATCHFGAVSMGNPHAVIEVRDVARAPIATIGPALQRHAAFPESVNVGFAEVVARNRIRLRVFERGVGETLACGSGACAAAVILMRRGRIDRQASVELPGGTLQIAWPSDQAEVTMAGPTAFVFEGDWWS